MSKRCPDCGFVNEDSRIYCGSCGEPLDAELRLIKSLEAQKKKPPVKETAAPAGTPAPRPKKTDDGDYNFSRMSKEQKSSPLPWILLAVAAVVVVGFLILSYAV